MNTYYEHLSPEWGIRIRNIHQLSHNTNFYKLNMMWSMPFCSSMEQVFAFSVVYTNLSKIDCEPNKSHKLY